MNIVLLTLILSCSISFLAVNWIYFKILRIAFDKNLVDCPNARKLQKRPIPVLGGIAVFFGMLVGVLSAMVITHLIGEPLEGMLLPILTILSITLYIGAMDDIIGLSPVSRLVLEMLLILAMIYSTGMCIDTFRGMWGIGDFSWWLAVPLTVFACIGIVNAINMIDGVNGLSSGLCILWGALYGVVFLRTGEIKNAVLAFSIAGALLPFYIHNVFGEKSRMFIGDAGTMVMGMLVSWFLICTLSADSEVEYYTAAKGVNMIALSLAILSVPVFDTLRVMTMRMIRGKSPFLPDKTHLHHIFVNIGVSHFITSTSEILMVLVIVAIWGISVLQNVGLEGQLYIVIIASMVLVWGTYLFLSYHVKRHTSFLHWLTKVSIRSHLGRKEWWQKISALLDAPCKHFVQEKYDDVFAQHLDARLASMDNVDYKEQDRKKILEYMRGRAEVYVQDIIDHSGAEKLRVYPILFEEIQSGYVFVLKESTLATPVIVALKG